MVRRYIGVLIAGLMVLPFVWWLVRSLLTQGHPTGQAFTAAAVAIFVVLLAIIRFEERFGLIPPPSDADLTDLFDRERPSAGSRALGANLDAANDTARQALGRFQHRDLQRAIAGYDEVIRMRPDDADAFNDRGWIRQASGDTNGAIRDYDEALRLNPHVERALQNRGISYFRKGEYDRALRDWDSALVQHQGVPELLFGRGVARWLTGDTANGEADILEARRYMANVADVMGKLGVFATECPAVSRPLPPPPTLDQAFGRASGEIDGAPIEPAGDHIMVLPRDPRQPH